MNRLELTDWYRELNPMSEKSENLCVAIRELRRRSDRLYLPTATGAATVEAAATAEATKTAAAAATESAAAKTASPKK